MDSQQAVSTSSQAPGNVSRNLSSPAECGVNCKDRTGQGAGQGRAGQGKMDKQCDGGFSQQVTQLLVAHSIPPASETCRSLRRRKRGREEGRGEEASNGTKQSRKGGEVDLGRVTRARAQVGDAQSRVPSRFVVHRVVAALQHVAKGIQRPPVSYRAPALFLRSQSCQHAAGNFLLRALPSPEQLAQRLRPPKALHQPHPVGHVDQDPQPLACGASLLDCQFAVLEPLDHRLALLLQVVKLLQLRPQLRILRYLLHQLQLLPTHVFDPPHPRPLPALTGMRGEAPGRHRRGGHARILLDSAEKIPFPPLSMCLLVLSILAPLPLLAICLDVCPLSPSFSRLPRPSPSSRSRHIWFLTRAFNGSTEIALTAIKSSIHHWRAFSPLPPPVPLSLPFPVPPSTYPSPSQSLPPLPPSLPSESREVLKSVTLSTFPGSTSGHFNVSFQSRCARWNFRLANPAGMVSLTSLSADVVNLGAEMPLKSSIE
eukprot:749731-Hanusia_phi.AAC.4